MEVTASEPNQYPARILAAAEEGEQVTVTKNGGPVALLSPVAGDSVLPYPVDPMGDIDIPDIGGPDLSDDDIAGAPCGMSG